MTRLILDIESPLSPGTLFERASQALRECKLTEEWEILRGEACVYLLEESEIIQPEQSARAEQPNGSAMRKRIAAAHQEAELGESCNQTN